MPTCVYDNANTLRREFWQNGRIVGTISVQFIEESATECDSQIIFGLLISSRFGAGLIYGDYTAMLD